MIKIPQCLGLERWLSGDEHLLLLLGPKWLKFHKFCCPLLPLQAWHAHSKYNNKNKLKKIKTEESSGLLCDLQNPWQFGLSFPALPYSALGHLVISQLDTCPQPREATGAQEQCAYSASFW